MNTFKCVRYCTSSAEIITFNDDSIQQPGTFIQQAHSTSSVKGKSRLVYTIRVSSDLDSTYTITTTIKSKKVNTTRASNKEKICPFKL